MKTIFSKIIVFALVLMMSVTLLGVTGTKETSAAYTRYVVSDFLNVRKEASGSARVITKYYWKDQVDCLGTKNRWTRVSVNGTTGYVATEYLSTTCPMVTYKSAYTRYVKTVSTIRKTPCTGSQSLGSYASGKKITCYGTSGTWTVVKVNGKEGFVKTANLSIQAITKSTGQRVVEYAKRFVGNPYVYGGTSLTHGADCSGFVMSVYKHFGYSLPRTSSQQRKSGRGVSLGNRKQGDLICYSGHIGIYIGNNKIVHASNSKPYPRGGIKISSMNIYPIVAVRRIAN